MKNCPKCGRDNRDDATMCRECGARLDPVEEKITCPICGTENLSDAKFCDKCGRPFGSGKEKGKLESILIKDEKTEKNMKNATIVMGVVLLLVVAAFGIYYAQEGHTAYVGVQVHSTHVTETVDVQIIIDGDLVYTIEDLEPGDTASLRYYEEVHFSLFDDSKLITVKAISTGGGLGKVTDSKDVIVKNDGCYTVDLYI